MTRPWDSGYMRAALTLARRGLGQVAPNPAVGCVVVAGEGGDGPGRVVGRGWTGAGGRPHAETEALRRAGAAARGATAYVSLEPCNHHGKTPPCAEALLEAGIARVVAAVEDPDPRVAGGGMGRLRDAGVEVSAGVLGDQAADLNAGFFMRVRRGRPLFTLKTATTLDGRIATHSGHSQWITGEAARQAGHALRAEHDAIMVGVGTALADDPQLTCRLPGLADRSPLRIVFDSRLRLPLTSRLVADAQSVPTWIVTRPDAEADRRAVYEEAGVEVIAVEPGDDGLPDPREAALEFGRRGLTRVLVEGGSHLAAALFEHDLVDRIAWMRAPRVMGGDGMAAIAPFGVDRLEQTPTYVPRDARAAGDDHIEMYEKINPHWDA